MEEFTAQLDAAQLSDLCCGTGWGVQDENNPVITSSESVPEVVGNEHTHWKVMMFTVFGRTTGRCAYHTAAEATDSNRGKRGRYTITVRYAVGNASVRL